jgi:2-polyprenyl-3-methyl-5-hydroxy-6-metoxy-1,4-benzoquinol methylase
MNDPSSIRETKEPQYDISLNLRDKQGFARFGLMSNVAWHEDPKRLSFLFARYKFVSKMLSGLERVLEVGCADGFATRVVRQEVNELVATDFDPLFIADAMQREDSLWPVEYRVHDMCVGPIVPSDFDAAYAVDVLEHIKPEDEPNFLGNMVKSIKPTGVVIVGTPSVESQVYASTASKAGHVNCKTGESMRDTLSRYFHNVFIFSMNDEVVHTGFYRMSHYIFGIGANPKLP